MIVVISHLCFVSWPDVKTSEVPEEGTVLPPPPEESPVSDTTAASDSAQGTEEETHIPPPEPLTEPAASLGSPPPNSPTLNGPATDASSTLTDTSTPPEPEAGANPEPIQNTEEPSPVCAGSQGEDRTADLPSEPATEIEAATCEGAAVVITNSATDLTGRTGHLIWNTFDLSEVGWVKLWGFIFGLYIWVRICLYVSVYLYVSHSNNLVQFLIIWIQQTTLVCADS